MKKHLLFVVLIMALVLCFSWGVSAAITTSTDNPNKVDVASDISSGYSSSDLWIGTLAAWKAAGGTVQDTSTFFENGEAIADNDIIITNGVCGIVVAVGTRNPWGYPAGSVLDAGTADYTSGAITTATGNRDMTWSIEPLVNDWDSWAPDNCGTVGFTLVDYNFDTKTEGASANSLKTLKVFRIYDINDIKFNVVTYYSIAPDQSYAYMYNVLENTTGAATGVASNTEDDLYTSFSVTNKGDDGGAMYGVGQSIGSYANSGGKEYFCGLYCPESKYIDGSVGYKQLYVTGDFDQDQTKLFDCYIVLSDTPDFTALNTLIQDQSEGDLTTVSGTATPGDTVVVEKTAPDKDGELVTTTYGWYYADADTGAYSFAIPRKVADDNTTYSMFLEADGYADSATTTIDNTVTADTDNTLAIGAAKKQMTLNVKDQDGNPIYAKVEVFESHDGGSTYVSAYPTVRFNGDSIYYTEADSDGESTGVVNFEVETGDYKVVVYGEGYWFYSLPVEITGNTSTGKTLNVTIDEEYSTPEGWLSADLHHHGNKNDAFSSPEVVIKSLAAAGLDVGCMTDHDFTTNNEEMETLAEEYGLTGYIPSEEISCSWSHFNVLPLTDDGYTNFLDVSQDNNVMNQFAQLPVFVAQTHDTGAAITANHPWCSYGLFYADAYGSIPGGYTDDYDNIEINAARSDAENVDTMITATQLWTSYQDGTSLFQDINGDDVVTEKAHYLVGGSDTHDVEYPGFSSSTYTNNRGSGWYCSGKARTFAYVGTDVTENTSDGYIEDNALAYDAAVVAGNSYVSTSPVLDMDKIPGETYDVYENSYFEANVTVQDVYDGCQFFVLTKTGTADIKYLTITQSKRMKDYLTYDEAATNMSSSSYDDTTDTYTYHVCASVGEDDTWVALLVVDGSGNYAITNPWWVNSTSFSDVPDMTWYKNVLVQAFNLDIVNGYTDGTFDPQGQITRAEFAQMLYGLLNGYYDIDATNTNVSFSDVKSGAWYYDAVMYMAQRGYISGYGDGTFKPNNYITRAEISQIIYGVAMANFKDTLNGGEEAYFTDVAKGAWYYKAIMTLADAGWVKGYTKDQAITTSDNGENMMETHPYFLPETTATRAESVQFISRMFADFYNNNPQ